MFGNSMHAANNPTQKKFDFEVKQMKEMYTQQLTKAKEEINKLKTNCQDKDQKL